MTCAYFAGAAEEQHLLTFKVWLSISASPLLEFSVMFTQKRNNAKCPWPQTAFKPMFMPICSFWLQLLAVGPAQTILIPQKLYLWRDVHTSLSFRNALSVLHLCILLASKAARSPWAVTILWGFVKVANWPSQYYSLYSASWSMSSETQVPKHVFGGISLKNILRSSESIRTFYPTGSVGFLISLWLGPCWHLLKNQIHNYIYRLSHLQASWKEFKQI